MNNLEKIINTINQCFNENNDVIYDETFQPTKYNYINMTILNKYMKLSNTTFQPKEYIKILYISVVDDCASFLHKSFGEYVDYKNNKNHIKFYVFH